jgi:endoglucanase
MNCKTFASALALSAALMLGQAHAQEPGPAARAFAPIDPAVQTSHMGRGVNVLGFDPLWDNFANRQFKAEHFQKIRAAGFSTIRVVLFGFRHMDAQNRLDPKWLSSLDWVVQNALANGLTVILENQDMAWCAEHADACKPKLTAFWEQVAGRYRDQPASVLFELMNEPNGPLDAVWNDWIPELLQVVRRSNPTRNVVVDAPNWASLHKLDALALPASDRHLIATIHYYDPRSFTHQGAGFAEEPIRSTTGVTWGSAEDRRRLHDDFALARQWSLSHRRPLLLGEFGAYEKAPMPSRVSYLSAVAREAEANGWPWINWQFDHDFAVYDMSRDAWVQPVLDALIHKREAP